MTINERFKVIIKSLYNGNKRSFALAIGVSATVIENVVGTRQGKPSYDVLEKIFTYTNVSADWLLSGKGQMLKNEYANDSITHSGTFTNSTITSQIGSGSMIKQGDKFPRKKSGGENEKLKDEIIKLKEEIKKLKEKDKISSSTINTLNTRLADKDAILVEKERFIQSLLEKK